MISTRLVELVIDTVLCLTLAKWETVSGQFGGYLSWGHFRLGARSCPMHDARRDSGSASPAIVRRVGGWSSGLGGSAVRLRCEHFEHVAVRIPEIKPASATTVIDLHVVEGAGSAAISNALGADAVEDAVKLHFVDFEGVVVTLELRVIVEIEGQRVVDPQGREVGERTFIAQTQDAGEETRRCFLVMRRDDRMVEHNGHRHLLAGDPRHCV